ncbi:MAG: AgmX/PglI C-terminal domain-containing protein [Gammaproteobacteria bacterium]|nr:AgmX/PglI C-terminal domain-containing protein [Gammaproteobacteria bacterium]
MEAVDSVETSAPGQHAPPAAAGDSQALQTHLAQARERLDARLADLRALDAELERLASPRKQHRLLQEACNALDELRASDGAQLFWDDAAGAQGAQERIRRARDRIGTFQLQINAVDDRRRGLLDEIARHQDHSALLEDDLFEALEQEERRRLEWIIEREINAVRSREAMLPWSHRGEEDRRFRKSLGMALLISLLIALLVHWIPLPVIAPSPEPQIPKRVVAMMLQMQPKPLPPPVVQRQPPPVAKLVHEKPSKMPAPQQAKPDEKPQPAPQKPVPQGLLAYRQDLAAVNDPAVVAHLGRNAQLRNAVDKAVGLPERAMLTTNAPGSSGGIRLATLSRGLGPEGGAERRAIHGGALTRASSGLTSLAGAAHPLSHGPGPGRTDEEIQIVFDRHKAELYRLYNQQLRRDPTLQGKMILRLTIEPDGSVSFCALQSSDMNAPVLADQVVAHVKTFDFGAKAVPAITIVYPIDFLPAT